VSSPAGTLTSLVSLIARHGVLPSASGHGKRLMAAGTRFWRGPGAGW